MASTSLLEVVNLSPRAVAAKSQSQWLDAWAPDGIASVEDPCGSPTHHGREGFRKFHSALIEPHHITFDIHRDFVDKSCDRVVRIVTIHIAYFNNQLNVGQMQPAHLVYDVDRQSDRLLALRANWEIFQARMMGSSALARALSFVMMLIAPFIPLVVKFGLSFSAVYSSSFLVGPLLSGGKLLNGRLMQAVRDGDATAFERLFADASAECVQCGGRQLTPKQAFAALFSKTTKFELLRPAATATYRTACWYERETNTVNEKLQGVYHFESHKKHLLDWDPRITSMYLYEEPA